MSTATIYCLNQSSYLNNFLGRNDYLREIYQP